MTRPRTIRLIDPVVMGSHRGQREGSLRKKRNKAAKLIDLMRRATESGMTAIQVRQADQKEVEQLAANSLKVFSESFRHAPVPRQSSFSRFGW